jgi:uncharacterized protein (TIGR02594 family)
MFQMFTFRRPLFIALALCAASTPATFAQAQARPDHGAARYARADHASHLARRQSTHRQERQAARSSRWERGVALMQAGGFADTHASISPSASMAPSADTSRPGFASSGVVAEARRHLGGNPTARGRLWCARFMNMVLQRSGYRGTGSDMASSFAQYGQRVSGPQVGAIAVMSRGRRGGHVGVVTGTDTAGNPIVISGNNGNRVREAPVSRGRIYAYVMPTS